MSDSLKYNLDKVDGLKILKGLGVALGGAVLTYASQIVVDVDFGDYTPLVVALSAVLINAFRKYLAGK